MKTHFSFTFIAKPIESPVGGIQSAGRWDTSLQAAQAAGAWLVNEAMDSANLFTVAVIQVEELDLLEARQ
jgi:hypothetical protein